MPVFCRIPILLPALIIVFMTALPSKAFSQNREDSVQYFQYWVEYGEKAQQPGGLNRMNVNLMRNSLYFSRGQPSPMQFQCQTDGAINRDLVPALTALDLADWPGQLSEDALYDLPEDERANLCRWSLTVVFEPESPNAVPRELRLCGADDGSSPKRLAFEAALQGFFLPRIEALMAETPRRVESLYWREKSADSRTAYTLDTDEDGVLTLERRLGNEDLRMAVRPDIAEALEALIRDFSLEKRHGFRAVSDQGHAFMLQMTFDTRQSIEISGHDGPEGMPPDFGTARAALLRLLDEALKPPVMSRTLPQTTLAELFFSVSGMVLGERIRLYERMDKDGPVIVLSRGIGNDPENRKEAVVDAPFLSALEALLEKHGIRSWNGFRGRPMMQVLDGESFSLSIRFRDGSTVEASGNNRFPNTYQDFRIELNELANTMLGKQE